MPSAFSITFILFHHRVRIPGAGEALHCEEGPLGIGHGLASSHPLPGREAGPRRWQRQGSRIVAWPVAGTSKPLKANGPKRGLRNTAISGRPLNGLNADPVDFFMKPIRLLPAVVLFVAAMCPAFAADPVFPPGVRVGMTPLVGLSRAKSFIGFETEDQSVKVLVTELPAEAYGEVMNAFKANPAGSGGIKPESIETSAGLAYYTAENAKHGATTVRLYSMILPCGTVSCYG